jgi:hypothetical protein
VSGEALSYVRDGHRHRKSPRSFSPALKQVGLSPQASGIGFLVDRSPPKSAARSGRTDGRGCSPGPLVAWDQPSLNAGLVCHPGSPGSGPGCPPIGCGSSSAILRAWPRSQAGAGWKRPGSCVMWRSTCWSSLRSRDREGRPASGSIGEPRARGGRRFRVRLA